MSRSFDPPAPAPRAARPAERSADGSAGGADRSVGIVVIGRNEGARLRASLASVLSVRPAAAVVYVDSGSTDGSVEHARGLGVHVVALDMSRPFTAARARNAGARALFDVMPDGTASGGTAPDGAARGGTPAFVQFIDGDCVLAPDWLDVGAAALAADPSLAVVAGRVREIHPDATPFNRLADMEWDTPVGPAHAVGGIALYRRAAFEAVGGFDPTLICGEEPELCFRLRAAGWGVERLDAEMTRHDAAMTQTAQWARRSMRTGWAFAEGAARMGRSPERYNVRERRRTVLWGGLVPAAVALCLLAALGLGLAGSELWPWALGAGLAGLAAYPLMMLRVAAARRRARGDPWRHALLYGAAAIAGKPFEMEGLRRFHAARARGETGRIIEYKT